MQAALPEPKATMTTALPHFAALSPDANDHDAERRQMLLVTGGAVCAGTLATALPFVSSFAPSERARAQGAAVEARVDDIPPGAIKTVEWRGKPVWILRRTPEMLATLPTLNSQLADPESQREQQPAYAQNASRAIKDELLVVTAILHSPGLLAQHGGCWLGQPQRAGRLEGRILLPLPWLHLRPGGTRVQKQARTYQPGNSAAPIPERCASADWRRRQGLSTPQGTAQPCRAWQPEQTASQGWHGF
jgi:ubiquinol-cytochrome c reductase iron-sulfur subunit